MTTCLHNGIALVNAAAAADIGYDQSQRWSFLDKKARRILSHKEGDCSAVTWAIYWLAGYPVPDKYIANPAVTCFTGNSVQISHESGFDVIPVKGWTLAQIQERSVPLAALLGLSGHIMIRDDSPGWFSMNIDENGRIAGGRAGDQTGNESSVRPLWARTGGWDFLIIPKDAAGKPVTMTRSAVSIGLTVAQWKALQAGLNRVYPLYSRLTVDGINGPATVATVKEFQRRAHLVVDGIVGPATIKALATSGIKL